MVSGAQPYTQVNWTFPLSFRNNPYITMSSYYNNGRLDGNYGHNNTYLNSKTSLKCYSEAGQAKLSVYAIGI